MPVVAKIVYWKSIRDKKQSTFSVFYLCMSSLFQENLTLRMYYICICFFSVYKAAKLTGVPKQDSEIEQVEELLQQLIFLELFLYFPKKKSNLSHIMSLVFYLAMYHNGYGYTRFDLRCIATDMSVYLNKRKYDEKILGEHWLYGFLARNPTLKVTTPKARANNATKEKTT